VNDITHPEMVAGLAKNGTDIINELTPESIHLLHMAVGITGESGELSLAIYNSISFDKIDKENVLEELGDLEFYLEGFRQGLDINRQDTIVTFKMPSTAISDLVKVKDYVVKLNGEASLMLDYVKKHVFYVKPIKFSNVMDSLKVIEHCMSILRDTFGIKRHETLEHNIAKLGDRYEGHSYSNEQAINRADKA